MNSYQIWEKKPFYRESINGTPPDLVITQKQKDEDIHLIISDATNYIKKVTNKTRRRII